MTSRSNFGVCESCGGFVPSRASSCVHCNASRRPLFERLRVGALGGAFGGGAIAFTLMACYGMPPCEDGTRSCHDDNADDGGADRDAARDAHRPDVQVRDSAAGDAADPGDGAADPEGALGDGGDDPDAGDAG